MEKKQQMSLLTFFSKSPKVPTPKSKTNTPKNININNNDDDSTGDQSVKSKPNGGVNENGSSPELKSKTASSKKIDTNADKKSSTTTTSSTTPSKTSTSTSAPSKTTSNGDRVPGDVVWARLEGYPWWPSMVCVDPNSKGAVYTRLGKIHVQFFDSTSSHAWVCS